MNSRLVKTIKRSVPDPVVKRGRKLIDSLSRSPVGAPSGIRTEISRQLNRKSEFPPAEPLRPVEDQADIRLKLPILGSAVSVVAVKEGPKYVVGAIGTSKPANRWLNDMLVTESRLYLDARDRHVHALGSSEDPDEVIALFVSSVRKVMTTRLADESGKFDTSQSVSAYWSAGVVNFGDWSGPHIINRLTGRRPLLPNRVKLDSRVVYSVGSILGWFNRSNVDVWGSGLMRPFTNEEIASRRKLTGIEIHAVRGKLTQQHLVEQIGWNVPDVYGDPALLLPRLYTPHRAGQGKVAFTPHGTHQKYFAKHIYGEVNFVDVKRNFRDVADAVSGARAVVSTSLHGLIVAQAYQVPWVWLRIDDHPLWGGADFKFEDFFSTLDDSGVSSKSISIKDLPTVDIEALAEQAHLPGLAVDLDKLQNALPVSVATGAKHLSPALNIDHPL